MLILDGYVGQVIWNGPQLYDSIVFIGSIGSIACIGFIGSIGSIASIRPPYCMDTFLGLA
jgi:hypothetical protein